MGMNDCREDSVALSDRLSAQKNEKAPVDPSKVKGGKVKHSQGNVCLFVRCSFGCVGIILKINA